MPTKIFVTAAVLASAAMVQTVPANAERFPGAYHIVLKKDKATNNGNRAQKRGKRGDRVKVAAKPKVPMQRVRKNERNTTPAWVRNAVRAQARVVRGWGNYYGPRPHDGCRAVARTGGGYGKALRMTRAKGFGPRACRKAMRKCNRKLDRRQARGFNPYAACVVAGRF